VTLQAERDARATPTNLSQLYVRNGDGRMVPLGTLGQLRPTVGPETVPHYNLFGTALINGSAAAGYSSNQAIAAMQRAATRVLPADFGYEWTGITYQELKAGSVAALVFALAIVFVFLFLAAQYESWSMPFMVILAVPLALLGAVLALWLRGRQIDVYAQVGGATGLVMSDVLVLASPTAATGSAPASGNYILRIPSSRAAKFAYIGDNGKYWLVLRPARDALPTRPTVAPSASLFGGR